MTRDGCEITGSIMSAAPSASVSLRLPVPICISAASCSRLYLCGFLFPSVWFIPNFALPHRSVIPIRLPPLCRHRAISLLVIFGVPPLLYSASWIGALNAQTVQVPRSPLSARPSGLARAQTRRVSYQVFVSIRRRLIRHFPHASELAVITNHLSI